MNWKDVFGEFMLEKACDTIERQGVWQMQRVYGAGGKRLKSVQSFYDDSKKCIRIGMDVWFLVSVGLRPGLCDVSMVVFYSTSG